MAHYSPTLETDRRITRDEIYLVDSGGQYWDGTTDITRTVHYGSPTDDEIDSFTRVLKGFISLNRAIYPPNAPVCRDISLYEIHNFKRINFIVFIF